MHGADRFTEPATQYNDRGKDICVVETSAVSTTRTMCLPEPRRAPRPTGPLNPCPAPGVQLFRTYAETEQLPTMDDLDRVIGAPDPMPPGVDIQPLGRREYGFLAPGRNGLEQGDERPCIQ